MIGTLLPAIGLGTVFGEANPVYLAFSWLILVPTFYGGLVLLAAIGVRNRRRRLSGRREPRRRLRLRLDDLATGWPGKVVGAAVFVAAAPFMLVILGTFLVMAAVVIVVALPLLPVVLDLIEMVHKDDAA